MEISINRRALSDAPYHEGNEGICTFDQTEVNNFVHELIYGNQTCYLVSGYRGVGKTSFINKVRELVEKESQVLIYKDNKRKVDLDNKKPETYHPVFVYTSFAKYNSKTAFLRQMIRSLFLAFEEKKVNSKSLLDSLTENVQDEFRKLNHRTFFDVRTQYEISKESVTELSTEFNAKVQDLVGGLLKVIVPAPVLALLQFIILNYQWPIWIVAICWLAALVSFVLGLLQVKKATSKRSSERRSISADELYDDEIASYYFEKTLKSLKAEGYKIVFILDELDKVNEQEISNLINEMKPHLLSGWADFIVVAGQQLTYRYVSAFSEDDDEVVGSLFSKVFHVPLKRTIELHNIVKEKIFDTTGFTESQLERLDGFIASQIFHSSRIPRILINQVRQMVAWNNDRPFIAISDSDQEEACLKVVEEIDGIIKDTIEPRGYKEVVRDYLIVQLYRTAIKLQRYQGRTINTTEILGKFQKSAFFHHPLYFDELAPCLTKLLVRLEPVLKFTIPKQNSDKLFDQTSESNDVEEGVESTTISSSAIARSLDVFKRELDECAWVLRVTHLALNDASGRGLDKYTTYDLLSSFIKNGFLQLTLPQNPLFKRFLTSPNVLDDRDNLQNAFKITQEARIDFNTIAYTVLRAFLMRVLKTIFSEFALTELPGEMATDFTLLNASEQLPNLLVDFKFLKTHVSNIKASEFAEKLITHNVESGKGNYLGLVIFTSEAKDSYEAEAFKLRSDLQRLRLAEGENAILDDKFHITIISIQFLTKMFDEFIILKNRMWRYDIDGSGLPKETQYGIMPSRNFVFHNQHPLSSDSRRNDHGLLEISKVPSELILNILPENSPYWRCGLKFSPNGHFPRFEEGRHIENYPDIHVSVGEPKNEDGKPLEKDGKLVWDYANHLRISSYFIKPLEIDWAFDGYKGGIVTLKFVFESKNRVKLNVFADGSYVNSFTYEDDRLNYFKLAAWADHLNFRLDTEILIQNSEDKSALKGGDVVMASSSHRLNSSINGEILRATDGVFSIWGFVTDVHHKIFGEELHMYLAGYASNQGKDLQNPSLARYPNAWGIDRIAPTHKNPLGLWRFHCNNIRKDSTQLTFKDALPNGWHLFSIAWSQDGNYIKFFIDDKIVDQSEFTNWPSDFTHSIRIGIWASGSPEFYFNSKVGPWQFVKERDPDAVVRELLKQKPE